MIANVQRRLLDEGWDPFTVVGSMGASCMPVTTYLPIRRFASSKSYGAPGFSLRWIIATIASNIIDAQISPALCVSELSMPESFTRWLLGSATPSVMCRNENALNVALAEYGARRIPKYGSCSVSAKPPTG